MFVLRYFVHKVQYIVFCSSAECDQCHSLFSAVSCCLVLTGSETSFYNFFHICLPLTMSRTTIAIAAATHVTTVMMTIVRTIVMMVV